MPGAARPPADMRDKFAPLLEALARDELEHWRGDREGRLAYVVLCDQFSRNVYRRQARAFALDARALALVKGIMAEPNWMRACKRQEVYQFALVLMHSESAADGEGCLEVARGMEAWAREEGVEAWVGASEGLAKFAAMHLEQVRRFGRYPGRNAALGRASTEEELEFLKGGNTFGQ